MYDSQKACISRPILGTEARCEIRGVYVDEAVALRGLEATGCGGACRATKALSPVGLELFDTTP